MGDRGNVCILEYPREDQEQQAVYLYTHWSGEDLPRTVQLALKRKQRWDDNAYLARIIFCEMIKGCEGDEAGFGISTGICDNEHPIVVVDPNKQVIGFADEGEPTKPYISWPFQEFIKLKGKELEETFSRDFRAHGE